MNLLSIVELTTDFVFPLSPRVHETTPASLGTLPTKTRDLKFLLLEQENLLTTENARRQGAEARLSTILGLSSIAGTIVYSAIVAQAAGTLQVDNVVFRWVLGLGSFYLALQICSAILSAITGLSRRGYLAATQEDIVPNSGEGEADYLVRRLTTGSQLLADHQTNNNVKITAMANAHRALQNFIWALLLLALVGTVAAIFRPNDTLIDRAKKDQQLRELLRGPQGPPGPQGSAGPQGPAGPPGRLECGNRCKPLEK